MLFINKFQSQSAHLCFINYLRGFNCCYVPAMYYIMNRICYCYCYCYPWRLVLENKSIQIRNLIADYFLFIALSLCLVTIIILDIMHWIK